MRQKTNIQDKDKDKDKRKTGQTKETQKGGYNG